MKLATMLTFSKKSVEVAVAAEAGPNVEFGKAAAATAKASGRTGTPGKVTAAPGMAHEVRVRKAEQWAAARKQKLEAGGKWGRRRGRGAQLRRQVGKRQKTMDVWRGQQVELERRRQQQQRVEVKTKEDNKWLGELAELQRRCDGRVAKAEKGRAEQEKKVDLLQQEIGSLLQSCTARGCWCRQERRSSGRSRRMGGMR